MTEENNLSELGGYKGLINSSYKKIWEEIPTIKDENDYDRDSIGFAHWFFSNILNIDEQKIGELITDDYDDWGIDAININNDEDVIELYQFKLPTKENNIENEVGQNEISNFLNGYKICSSGVIPDRTNVNLTNKINEITESEIFNYKLIFVTFSKGLGYHAKEVLDREFKLIQSTGNEIEFEIFDSIKITNRNYVSKRKTKDFEITLNQIASGTGFMSTDNAQCYSIYAKLDEIADICETHNDIIFDENVRLFHGSNSNYNKGIISSAKNDFHNFHLYNNGIVMLSTRVRNNDSSKKVKIENPKVVNGCQTMNSLLEAKKQNNNTLEGTVLVKIIEISDPLIRQNVSIYLNSQTEIKDSYLISNLPIILNLQDELTSKGYFLERQANQLALLKKTLSKKDRELKLGKSDSKVINLELAIQVYATFYENLGNVAKLNKAKLFNIKTNLEKIFKNLNSEKVSYSYEIYKLITNKITNYRQYRRNNTKQEFLNFMEIDEREINDYLFMNTGDLFILTASSLIIKKDYPNQEEEPIDVDVINSIIKKSITTIKDLVKSDQTGKPPATLTKNNLFHRRIIEKLNE
jgi:hypothetical protein